VVVIHVRENDTIGHKKLQKQELSSIVYIAKTQPLCREFARSGKGWKTAWRRQPANETV